VPVLPFLVKDVGASVVAYGMLQSTLWTSQTLLAPVQGWISDKVGRRPVIILSLLISALGNGLLALSYSVPFMVVARIISGFGFQIALFRAYFADAAPKGARASKFGLIGVIQGFSLFGGPAVGGFVSKLLGRRAGPWLSAILCLLGALVAICWQPGQEAEERATRASTVVQDGSNKLSSGVQMVKLDLEPVMNSNSVEGALSPSSQDGARGGCMDGKLCRCMRKMWWLAKWLAKYDLYPLLTLNFFFRFAFAAYKSIFAFFCARAFDYDAAEVGMVLAGMGLAGMFVQGVLVRVIVARFAEERTLMLAMASTSVGFCLLSLASSLVMLVPALGCIAVGYGLAVPCLSALFSNVPVEQGIMQGMAGAIDRFGQAFGPLFGGYLLHLLGEARLMAATGVALASVSCICLIFIGDGCLSWMRQSLVTSSGYSQVTTTDEEEAHESTPLKSGAEADADAEVEVVPLKNGVEAAKAPR